MMETQTRIIISGMSSEEDAMVIEEELRTMGLTDGSCSFERGCAYATFPDDGPSLVDVTIMLQKLGFGMDGAVL